MFLTNYFVQNDENLLQKSCVVKAGSISPKRENKKLKKFKMNYFLNASTARSNFFLNYLFPPPSSTFSFCSKDDQSATREFGQIWLQDK